MPLYNSPARPPQLLQKGVPAYLFGNLNMLQGNALGYVLDTALTGTGALATLTIDVPGTLWAVNDTFTIAGGTGGIGKVTAETGGIPSAVALVTPGEGYSATTGATTTAVSPSTGIGLTVTTTVTSSGSAGSVTVQINQGPIPLVGDLLTVINTAQQSGLFNVTRAVITATNINAATGTGTISYALTGTNQSLTADPGSFISEPGESSEALVNNSFSVPVTVQAPQGDSQFTLPVSITFPTLPTAVTVSIQAAIRDIAAEYTTLGTVAVVAASAQTVGPFGQVTLQRGFVYRLAVTGLSGSGTITAKVG